MKIREILKYAHSDLIAVKGKGMYSIIIILALAHLASFLLSPFLGVGVSCIAFIAFNGVFTAEERDNSSILMGFLPADIKSSVYARFLTCTAANFIAELLGLLTAFISSRLKLYEGFAFLDILGINELNQYFTESPEFVQFIFTAIFICSAVITSIALISNYSVGLSGSTALQLGISFVMIVVLLTIIAMMGGIVGAIEKASGLIIFNIAHPAAAVIRDLLIGSAVTFICSLIAADKYEKRIRA